MPASAAYASTPYAVTVTEADGVTAVPGATVFVTPWPSGGPVASGSTSAAGEFTTTLAPGNYRLSVQKYLYEPYLSGEIVIGAAAVQQDVTLLPRDGAISGTLLDAVTDAPVASATLTATRISDGFTRPATSDANGDFYIDWLPAGDYELYIEKFGSVYEEQWYLGGENPGEADPISVSLGSATALGDVPLSPTGATLSGTVIAAETGDPFWPTSAGVRLYRAGETTWFEQLQADESGAWQLSGLAPGSYEVQLVAPAGHLPEWFDDARTRDAATPVSLSRGETRLDLDLVADAVGSISGTVTSQLGGGPLANIVVDAVPVGGGPVAATATTSVGLGTYTLDDLPSGDYLLSFTPAEDISPFIPEWYDDAPTSATATPVTVTAGATTTDIDAVLTPGAALYGAVTSGVDSSGVSDIVVDVHDGSTVVASGETDASGNIFITRIPAGTYTVRFSDPADAFIDQWFDGAREQSAAQQIAFTAGGSVFDVDAVLTARLTGTTVPTIIGDAQVGEVLEALAGAWGRAPVTVAFQWLADGVEIDGATGQTFTITADELGAELTVAATGSRTGYASETRTSEPTAAVQAGSLSAAPVPTIGVTGGVLAQSVALTANPGTWGPTPVALQYQWLRDGEPISGATSTIYVTAPADAGTEIALRVTGEKSGYTTVVRTSDPVGPVPFLDLSATPQPSISGSAEVGQTLTATPGSWSPAPVDLDFQWLRDGSPISGATSSTYTLAAADTGRDISVRVTGSKTGYSSVERTSDAVGPVAPAPGPIVPDVSRLAGPDRFATAVAVSQQWEPFAPGEGVVYLATAFGFADALSAAPAAAAQDAPLLLTQQGGLPGIVRTELRRLDPATVKVVGGTSAVSARVLAQVRSALPDADVVRISGADRYETSQRITADAFGVDGSPVAFIATGRSFPDALSASAAAGSLGAPVLLVDGTRSTIDSGTRFLLDDMSSSTVYIAGGTAVVSQSIRNQIAGFSFTSSVVRLAGADRYATAQAINAAIFDTAPAVYLATGTGFPDALAGAALAGSTSSPLYVVPPTCVPGPVLSQISDLGAADVVLLGGTAVLSSRVASLRRC